MSLALIVLSLSLCMGACARTSVATSPDKMTAGATARPVVASSPMALRTSMVGLPGAGADAPKPCPDPEAAPTGPPVGSQSPAPTFDASALASQVEAADETRKHATGRLLAAHPNVNAGKLCSLMNEAVGMMGDIPYSVAGAVDQSVAVVWGDVTKVTATADGADATVAIRRASPTSSGLQGSVRVRLDYRMDAYGPPWVLAVVPFPCSPVLVAGDEAVLILGKSSTEWRTSFGGQFPVTNGKIESARRASAPGAL